MAFDWDTQIQKQVADFNRKLIGSRGIMGYEEGGAIAPVTGLPQRGGAIPGPVNLDTGDDTLLPMKRGEYVVPVDAMIAKGRMLAQNPALPAEAALALAKMQMDSEVTGLKQSAGNPAPPRNVGTAGIPQGRGYAEGGAVEDSALAPPSVKTPVTDAFVASGLGPQKYPMPPRPSAQTATTPQTATPTAGLPQEKNPAPGAEFSAGLPQTRKTAHKSPGLSAAGLQFDLGVGDAAIHQPLPKLLANPNPVAAGLPQKPASAAPDFAAIAAQEPTTPGTGDMGYIEQGGTKMYVPGSKAFTANDVSTMGTPAFDAPPAGLVPIKDMSPGSQGAWEREQAINAMLGPGLISAKDRAAAIRAYDEQNETVRNDNLVHGVNQQNADANTKYLGIEGDVKTSKLPLELKGLQSGLENDKSLRDERGAAVEKTRVETGLAPKLAESEIGLRKKQGEYYDKEGKWREAQAAGGAFKPFTGGTGENGEILFTNGLGEVATAGGVPYTGKVVAKIGMGRMYSMLNRDTGEIEMVSSEDKAKNPEKYGAGPQDPNVKAWTKNVAYHAANANFVNTIDSFGKVATDIMQRYGLNGNPKLANYTIQQLIQLKGMGSGEVAALDNMLTGLRGEMSKMAEGSMGVAGAKAETAKKYEQTINSSMPLKDLQTMLQWAGTEGRTRLASIDMETNRLRKELGIKDKSASAPAGLPQGGGQSQYWKRPGTNSVPMGAVEDLRRDPSAAARKEFDEMFGAGYAATVLGK